jgi:cation diffusion facilitator family transporter
MVRGGYRVTKLLIKLFIRNSEGVDDPSVRTRYGILSGAVGIFINILLCTAKLFVGSFSNSIAITADAVNNLSDAGSSVVNLVGFRLAGKSADDEHPFGHGRIEYICSLVVSFLVLLMGVELVKSSVDRIINPKATVFSYYFAAILIISILGKLWMAYFNASISKRIKSPATGAIVADSLGDTAATLVTLISLFLSKFTALPLDGYMGVAVAAFVFVAGIRILKETIGPLLGESADVEFADKIENKVLSYAGVVGVHDLIVHNYGPGRNFGSAHVEVPSDVDILESHDMIDLIERNIKAEFGLDMVIHLDPIVVNDERINKLREQTTDIVKSIDDKLTIHDFRVVEGPTHTNLIFDLVVPHHFSAGKSELIHMVDRKLSEIDERYFAVITVERSFVGRNE